MNLRAFFFASLADSSAVLSPGGAYSIGVPEGGPNVGRPIFLGGCDKVPRSVHQ